MAIDNFIPQVWSARLLTHLDQQHVYSQEGVVNRDYEGEITAFGDTVKISQVGNVTVGDYAKNTNIGEPEELSAGQAVLSIDQAKYFNFQVDDIDAAQQKPKVMDEAMQRSAYGLNDTADAHIAAMMAAGATAVVGAVGAPKTDLGTVGKAYEYLVSLEVALDEQNVPGPRWVIVPPWFHGQLLLDDRFVKSGTPQGEERLVNGRVGEVAGFIVLKSNNVPNDTGSEFKIIAGHAMAASYAEQVVSVEGYRPEERFADAVKGLHVYGAKVVCPNALAKIVADARPNEGANIGGHSDCY